MSRHNIEAIYPLSPVQQGIFFHTLYDPESEVYFIQHSWVIEDEEFEPLLFRESWQRAIDYHPILRTAFLWESGKQALQVVCRQAELPFEIYDWRELPVAEQRRQLETLLEADRRRNFDLKKAPLMRLIAVRMGTGIYRVTWSYHHLLLDGWSVPILLKEIFAIYAGLRQGQAVKLAPRRPYRDYIAWLQKQDLATAEAYWRAELSGFTAPTPLVDDRPVSPLDEQGSGYAKAKLELSHEATIAITAMARKHRLTFSTIMQGVWALLLSHYSGEEDVVFGTSVSGRPTELVGVEQMLGMFINTLPTRVKISSQSRVVDWLQQLQKEQARARQYEYTPLVQIQGWSAVPRGAPLFESFLMFENAAMNAPLRDKGAAMKVRYTGTFDKTNYPLAVMAGQADQQLLIVIGYYPSRFKVSTINRMLAHLQNLLEQIAARPDQPVSDLEPMAEAERHQPLVEWNDTARLYPREKFFNQLFEARAATSPDSVAVVFDNIQLSYQDLNSRANRLAHYLRKRGVGPEVKVGIYIERSPELLVGLLGILKAGGCYVPIDPSYPKDRKLFMLDDAQISVLLTQQQMRADLAGAAAQVICLDSDWQLISLEDGDAPDCEIAADNLAYVLYTSGSTGNPKGVQISHRSFINYLHSMREELSLTGEDVLVAVTPISFDISMLELFLTLLLGIRIIIAKRDTAIDGAALIEELQQSAATVMQATPATWRALLVSSWRGGNSFGILSAGEALPKELSDNLLEKGGYLWNLYGPTEATVYSTIELIDSDTGAINIGRPIANTQVYILDGKLRLVPIGVAGELHIGGVGLARGYLNRPELTAEKFIPDPFVGAFGSRLYKTGDLARYMPDGRVEYLNRIDHQVKLRGFRIELGEIEVALKQHSGVDQAVVVAREDERGEKRLVSYIVPKAGEAVTFDDLRNFLNGRLPDYMVPTTGVILDSLPLTPNGKINRRALPTAEMPRGQAEYLPARTPLEELFVRIWADVLGEEMVGVRDNFFELGGHSILAIQIAAKTSEAGYRVTTRQIFQLQTIERIAQAVQSTRSTGTNEVDQKSRRLVMSPIQRWFFEQDLVDAHHFNMAVFLEIHQEISPAVLSRAIEMVVAQHDVFSARFRRGASGWEQFAAGPHGAVRFTREDLSYLGQPEQKVAINRLSEQAQGSLNLADGPVMRAVYFDLGKQTPQRLLIVIHHLFVDAISLRILMTEILSACRQLASGSDVVLEPEATSFRVWAEALKAYTGSSELQEEMRYWTAQPWGTAMAIPVDHPGGCNSVASVRSLEVFLTRKETQSLLQQAPKAYNTQTNDLLLAALAMAFEQWSGDRRLLVALESHGREELFDDLDLSRTVGWFTTITPVRLAVTESASPGETLKAVKEHLRKLPKGGIGYGVLRYMSEDKTIHEKLAALPLTQVSFTYLGHYGVAGSKQSPAIKLASESSGPTFSPRAQRPFLLEVVAMIRGDRLAITWRYSENLHRRTRIESLAVSYLQALRKIISDCLSKEAGSYTPADFPRSGLSQAELDEIVEDLQAVTS